ncbi:MAG TPA: UDP-3-O-(3-hydroxymyristoyl)glucosamine N-acyltransferase [Oceanipulchritudo sp.]|nr:UDP-3-O-(3-hydroxymyristoyl)glucosamine N-acyltransferase [Oceanipulchritudo sp.]
MKWQLSVEEIVTLVNGTRIAGEYTGEITGIADLRIAGPADLSFLSGGKYAKFLAESKASLVIVPQGQEGQPPEGQVWIGVTDPSLALAQVCGHVEGLLLHRPGPGIHPTAIVDPSAVIDPSATIGPYCLVGARARIGSGTVLESNVRVEQDAEIGADTILKHAVVIGWGCRVGNRCNLFPGVVLGADGFGYHSDKTGHHHLPQIGIVIIDDDVDIGANTCIDRARFSATRIGQGTKIDNLVQVGHNVVVGKHCILCAEVGIAGSAEIGNFVVMAGQVGVNGHIKVGDGVTATGQAGITKDIPPGTVLSGNPARPNREELKRLALFKQLPELVERVRELEARLAEK